MSACNNTTLTAVSEAYFAAFVLLGVIGCLVTFALFLFLFSCVGTQACKQRAARASEQAILSIPTAECATEEVASKQTILSIPTAERATEEVASEQAILSIPTAERATEEVASEQTILSIPTAERATE